MSTVSVDSRGRIYIPKEMRENQGDRYKIVELDSGIKLIPLSEDPIEGLRDALDGAEDIDLENLSEDVDEAARKELEEEFR